MLVTQFDKFVNRSTQQILGAPIERENLVPMLSTDIPAKLQNIEITENGTYYPESGYDGFYKVDVNTRTGVYPPIDALVNGTLHKMAFYGSYLSTSSEYVKKFLDNYARVKYGSTKGTSSGPGTIARTVELTEEMLQSISAFVEAFPVLSSAEYYAYVYGKTTMITDLGLVLLGDFSQGGNASGNALSDAITNYSAVLLQGVYTKDRRSIYNTSMLYINPALNTPYWTGMKDRNSIYDCKVTFTDANSVSLSGNLQVIIYGMP